jgi:chromosome segregation ATPase
MQKNRSLPPDTESNGEIQENPEPIIAVPAPQSFSLADAKSIVEIEVQADQLLNYINKLTTLADRACSTAIQQSSTVHRMEENRQSEISYLRRQLDRSHAQFREQQLSFNRIEESSRARIAALEARLSRKEDFRGEESSEIKRWRDENSALVTRLSQAEEAVRQAQSRAEQQLQPLTQELADLKLQLAKRDEIVQVKSSAIKAVEAELRGKILELEQQLRSAQTELKTQENQLHEKDALIQATAVKEAEIGQLIKRLSGECESLSAELQEKNLRLAQLEGKSAPATNDNKVWRRVIGRLQEDL